MEMGKVQVAKENSYSEKLWVIDKKFRSRPSVYSFKEFLIQDVAPRDSAESEFSTLTFSLR